MGLIGARASLVWWIVALYLVLTDGIMVVLIPPGVGAPIGEIVLLAFALTFLIELKHLPPFAAVAPMVPLVCWWALGFARLGHDFLQHGIWAVRDATSMIESTFLWVGFVCAQAPGFMERFSRRLRQVLVAGILYGLLYPFRDHLLPLSPVLTAPGGYLTTLLFKFPTGGLLMLTAVVRIVADNVRWLGLSSTLWAGALIVYCIVVFQMRTTYLQVLGLVALLAALRPHALMRMSGGMAIGFLVLALALAGGVEITGRLGEKFTLEFLVSHIAAIFGIKDDSGAVSGAAAGVGQRLAWWLDIWRRVTADAWTLFTGLGYGIPLTSFLYTGGQLVREPHNSLVSVFARLGLAGMIFFLWFQSLLVLRWWRTYRALRGSEPLWATNLLIILAFQVLLWIGSIGEDVMEKPFNTIPSYFLWGVVLNVAYRVALDRRQAAATWVASRPAPA